MEITRTLCSFCEELHTRREKAECIVREAQQAPKLAAAQKAFKARLKVAKQPIDHEQELASARWRWYRAEQGLSQHLPSMSDLDLD